MTKGTIHKLLVAVALVSSLFVAGMATAQIKATHPRIWLTDSLLTTLRARATANTPEWAALKRWNDSNLTAALPSGYQGTDWALALANYALGYQVLKTIDTALANLYAEKALSLMVNLSRDLQNPGDGLGGNAAVPINMGYPIRNHGVFLALGYDWLYDYPNFTDSLKTEFYNQLNAWIAWFESPDGGYTVGSRRQITGSPYAGVRSFNNYFQTYFKAVAFSGYATYPENPNATTLISKFNTLLNDEVIPTLNSHWRGGLAPEGDYGLETNTKLLLLLYAVNTATGQDILPALPWFKDLIYYQIHGLKPGRKFFLNNGDQSGAGTGVAYLPLLDALAYFHRGTPEGEYIQYLRKNLALIVKESPLWHKFMWYDSNAPAASYSSLTPSYHLTGTGIVLMRSDWGDSASWASFQAGKWFVDHQVRDQGHFTINRGNDHLVINSGAWRGSLGYVNDGTGSHYQYKSPWYNTVLVTDSGAGNIPTLPDSQGIYGVNTKVLQFREGGSYVYVLGDIASSYSPSPWLGKVNAVPIFTREFVFIRPNYFVIFDRVSTIDDRYTKRWAIHFKNEPAITGDLSQAVFGSSKVFLKSLTPSPATITKYPEPNDQGTNPSFTWRVEVTNPTAVVDVQFLNALYVTDSTTLNMPTTEKIAGTGLVGAHIQSDPVNWVAMFSSSQTAAPPTGPISYTITPTALTRHLVMNLQPNTGYTLSVTPDGSRHVINLAATGSNVTSSAEGTLAFELSYDGTTATDLATGNPIPLAPGTTSPVTLTSLTPSVPSPQPPGTSIGWTANASGGTSPLLYQFWLSSAGTWNMVRDYSTANTWTWSPTNAGDYYVSVRVKEQVSTKEYDVALDPALPYSISAIPVVLSSLAPSLVSPQAPGTSITWTANASGGTSPLLYQFWLATAGTWNIARDYATTNSWTWSPANAGDYYVTVRVKEQTSTKEYDVALDPAVAYSISSPPVVLSSFTPSLASPQPKGSSISWTASGSGGSSPLQYRFWLFSGGTWTMVRDYSPEKSWTWNPPTTGDYYVTVWVKEQNSTKQSDAALDPGVPYSIATPVVLNSLAPSVPSAQPRRTTIIWTANASGGASPLQYRFLLLRRGSWSIVQDYSTVNTWTWKPSAADNYYVTVWVKEQNSTKQYDVALDPAVPYTIK